MDLPVAILFCIFEAELSLSGNGKTIDDTDLRAFPFRAQPCAQQARLFLPSNEVV